MERKFTFILSFVIFFSDGACVDCNATIILRDFANVCLDIIFNAIYMRLWKSLQVEQQYIQAATEDVG